MYVYFESEIGCSKDYIIYTHPSIFTFGRKAKFDQNILFDVEYTLSHLINEQKHDKTNKMIATQRRLRSAESDQSFFAVHSMGS